MRWTPDEIAVLEKVAAENDGHCDRCKRVIKIYRYKANRTMALTMRQLLKAYKDSGGVNDIDVRDVQLVYGQRSQLSKVRLHGLIAHVKDADGKVVQSHWLITRKGFDWLEGQAIPTKVVNFGNQVLGHEGGTITIHEALGEKPTEPLYEAEAISTNEAGTYRHVREPQKFMDVTAEYKGYSAGDLKQGKVYTLRLNRLQVGKPVIVTVKEILQTQPMEYKDIAAFQRTWKVVQNG